MALALHRVGVTRLRHARALVSRDVCMWRSCPCRRRRSPFSGTGAVCPWTLPAQLQMPEDLKRGPPGAGSGLSPVGVAHSFSACCYACDPPGSPLNPSPRGPHTGLPCPQGEGPHRTDGHDQSLPINLPLLEAALCRLWVWGAPRPAFHD